MLLINRFRAGCLAFSSILLLPAIGCAVLQGPTPEPPEPIFVTPVAFEPRVPAVEPTAFPRLEERPTSTPTPWPARPFPLPTATAIPLPLPTAAPAPRSRPASTAVPTKIYRWTQIQRDYRDRRITYDQVVEQAVDTGVSRPQARIALAQIRVPKTGSGTGTGGVPGS